MDTSNRGTEKLLHLHMAEESTTQCSGRLALSVNAQHNVPFLCDRHSEIQRGGGGLGGEGVWTPLKNHKNIGFSSNIGPDPLKISKLPSQHSMLGHHRHASEGVLLAGR